MWFFFLAGHKKHYLISTFGNGPCWRQKRNFFLPNGPTGKNFNFKVQRKGKSCPNPGLPLNNTLNFNNYLNLLRRHIFCWTMK
jgi:hypothetical protein